MEDAEDEDAKDEDAEDYAGHATFAVNIKREPDDEDAMGATNARDASGASFEHNFTF